MNLLKVNQFKILVKYAWNELVRHKQTTLFLTFNFVLGLLGFFILQIFQTSLMNRSLDQARASLGGDISISARRSFSESERLNWEKLFKFQDKSRQYSFFSMLIYGNESKLVQVLSVDNKYPLYGSIKMSAVGITDDEPLVWVDPDLAENMNLQVGSMINLGDGQFKIAGQIIDDSTRLLRIGSLASRVIIHEKYLSASKLIQTGSTFSQAWSYQLPAGIDPIVIKKKIENIITDLETRIEAAGEGGEGTTQVLKYFTDYLGLVALVALGLCLLCGSYLLRWIFETRKRNIAIYQILGFQNSDIILIYFFQILILAVLSCIVSYVIVLLAFPALQNLVNVQFKLNIQLTLQSKMLWVTTVCGILAPIFLSLPQLIRIFEMSPNELIANQNPKKKISLLYWAWLLAAIIVFWGLSVWQSHSYKTASLFTAGVIFVFGIFNILSYVIFNFLEKNSNRFSWITKYAIKGLSRKRDSAELVFTTMGAAVMVLSLLPHIKSSILNEIRPDQKSQIPYLFLFDIQPDQVSSLQRISKKTLGYELKLNPLVRSRILKVNGVAYERSKTESQSFQTREEETEARFRNRGVNLTYRDHLQDSEDLIQGQLQPAFNDQTKLPQISLEKKYAERVGVSLNDIMTFDVQGIELRAQVGSYRSVKWTSFQPNFFILFPNNVLEQAPQIFLTSVPQGNASNIKTFQNEVVQQFKNISVIDINETAKKSLVYIDQMSLALQLMAWFALAVGIFIFIILLNTQIQERIPELNLLQILGADRNVIWKTLFYQFLFLILATIVVGASLSLVLVRILIVQLFDVSVQYDWMYLGILMLFLLPVLLLTLIQGLRPLQKLNPMDLIRQS